MRPLYFGDRAESALFGVLHQPDPSVAGRTAVLMSNPFGQECERVARLYRVLAERLCMAGLTVLRYQHLGTGDSAGGDDSGSLLAWREGVGHAHRRLLQEPGISQVIWLGTRLGATAMLSGWAPDPLPTPLRCVLWEPVIDGQEMMRHWRSAHVARIAEVFSGPHPYRQQWMAEAQHGPLDQVMGFAIAPAWLEQLPSVAPEAVSLAPGTDTTLLVEALTPAWSSWLDAQRRGGAAVQAQEVGAVMSWTAAETVNQSSVPAVLLKALVAACTQGAAA